MPRPKRNLVALKSSSIENQSTNNDEMLKANDSKGDVEMNDLPNAENGPNSMDFCSVSSGDDVFKVGDRYMVKYKDQYCEFLLTFFSCFF